MRTLPPSLRWWLAADLVSQLGSWAQALGLAWVVLERTGSTAALGAVLAAQAVPQLLLGPWGGAVADRAPLQTLLVCTQSAQALVALLLALLGTPSLPLVLLLAATQGFVLAVDGPAHAVYGTQLVAPSQLARAAALGSVSSSAGRVLGMALGGAAVAVLGASALFTANALSFAVVVAVVLRLAPAHPAERAPRSTGVRAGVAHARRTPELLVLLGLVLVCSSLGRSFAVTTAALVSGPLHAGPGAYAGSSALFAVGALLGGLLATRTSLGLPTVVLAAGLAAAGEVLLGLSPTVLALDVLVVPVAAACVLLDTAVGAHLTVTTAPSLRGRVLALRGTVSAAAAAGGAPLLGASADLLGGRATLVAAGSLVLLAVAASARTLVPAGPQRLRVAPLVAR